jgi:ribokinase
VPPGRVIVVGSVNIDLVIGVDRLPRAGETITGGRFGRHDGGKGGNQAVAAARLGATTLLIGAVGDDDFGREARIALESEGVDAGEVLTVAGDATGVALILVDRDGENLIGVASGANLGLRPEHIDAAYERLGIGPDDTILVDNEIPTGTAQASLRLARAAGASTVFNPAPPDGLDRATLGLADVLTPNRQELAALVRSEGSRLGRRNTIDDPVAAARSLLGASPEGVGPAAVLVSLGAAGAVLVEAGREPIDIPAMAVHAVDTVGAGDALNGAVAAALAAGRSLEEAARLGVVAASLSTTREGARPGMPTSTDVEAVLAAR